MMNLYSTKAVDVDRVLLVCHPKIFDLRSLAKESHVSLRQAQLVSETLIHKRIAVHDEGRYRLRLMDPSALLTGWATNNDFIANTKFIEYYTPEQDIPKFLEKLKGLNGPEYAITGLTGSLFVAPFVRPTNVHIYVKTEDDAKELANLLDLMPVEANGNIKFAIAKSDGVFYGSKKVDGINIVSLPQLYADLRNYPARGKEAASEVLNVIRDNWTHGVIG
jgi:hypothetical protein